MPEFTIAGKIPGEALIVAILEYASVHRATMSQENRDKWDAMQNRALENWLDFWDKVTKDA